MPLKTILVGKMEQFEFIPPRSEKVHFENHEAKEDEMDIVIDQLMLRMIQKGIQSKKERSRRRNKSDHSQKKMIKSNKPKINPELQN